MLTRHSQGSDCSIGVILMLIITVKIQSMELQLAAIAHSVRPMVIVEL